MKKLLVFILLGTLLFQSCGPSAEEQRLRAENEKLKAEKAKPKPRPKTRMDGAWYFYNNYSEFKVCLGDSYGCHTIKSVYFDGSTMKVRYEYKNGVLSGSVSSNGSYTGTYRTSSTSGPFDLLFRTDGTGQGSWSSSGFFSFSGPLSFENR